MSVACFPQNNTINTRYHHFKWLAFRKDNFKLTVKLASYTLAPFARDARFRGLSPLLGDRYMADTEEDGPDIGYETQHESIRMLKAMDEKSAASVVAAMEASPKDLEVQRNGCVALANLTLQAHQSPGALEAAVEAGILPPTAVAMKAHLKDAVVQGNGCAAFANLTLGSDAAGAARKQAAVDAGALPYVVAALSRRL